MSYVEAAFKADFVLRLLLPKLTDNILFHVSF